jgi:hypothetical protein
MLYIIIPMNAISPPDLQPHVHPLLVDIPETITEAEQALPLVQVIETHIPSEERWHELKSLCAFPENLEQATRSRPHELQRERQKVVGGYDSAYKQTLGYLMGDRQNVPRPSPLSSAPSKPEPRTPSARPAVPFVGPRSEPIASSAPTAGTGAMRAESAKPLDSVPSLCDEAPAVPVALGIVMQAPMPAPMETPTSTTAVIVPSPSEATKTAVFEAAPNIFQHARMSTGMAAIVFEFVRRWKLYAHSGFSTMREYAERQLGVSGENYREYARAGKAMWENFPERATRVIEHICGAGQAGPGAIAPPAGLPSVPSVSVLRVLPRALRQTDPSERAALIARVEAGQCTYDELRVKGKASVNGQPAFSTAPANDDVAIAPTESDESRADGAANRPDIFDDVPEFEEFVRLARDATGFLDRLDAGWSESGGPDIDPIRPRVRAIAKKFGELATEIDDTIIPRTACTACGHDGEQCDNCGGLGWLPRVPAQAKATAAIAPKAGRARRATRSTAGMRKKVKKEGA